jgi:hypothetical protein
MRQHLYLVLINLVFVVVHPALVLGFMYSYLFLNSKDKAFFCALAGGLFIDFLSGNIPGLTPFVLVLLTQVIFLIKKYTFGGLGYIAVSIFISNIIYLVILQLPDFIFSVNLVTWPVITLMFAITFSILNKYVSLRIEKSGYHL